MSRISTRANTSLANPYLLRCAVNHTACEDGLVSVHSLNQLKPAVNSASTAPEESHQQIRVDIALFDPDHSNVEEGRPVGR